MALGLIGLAILAVVLILAAGGPTAPAVYAEEYVAGDGASRIAVVPVEGTIATADNTVGGIQPTTTPEGLADALRQAGQDTSVVAVVIEVNSPGGGVTASDEMHQSILDFKKNTGKPVVVSMGDTAASGGYYISTAADRIVANDMGNAFREMTPDEREIIQSIVDESYSEFVGVISEGRGIPEERVREIADGRVYSGSQARDLGLVDSFGGLDEASATAGRLAGARDTTVVRYVQEPTLTETLLARLAPQEPQAQQIMEATGLDLEPKPYYLYLPGA
jgi:protease-4